mmetsp:Transcript_34926/g.76446  ORF Transcript_34926/g.76446 Transcript_34926/m.76446 type:complete len:115 (+) Transcript_34926:175-519(+)
MPNTDISAMPQLHSREPSSGPNREPAREPSRQPSRQPSRELSRGPGRGPSRQLSREPNRELSRKVSRGPSSTVPVRPPDGRGPGATKSTTKWVAPASCGAATLSRANTSNQRSG